MKYQSNSRFTQLADLFTELDKRAEVFSAVSQLSCPEGCGLCCEHADTEVSRLEAEYIAIHLRGEAPELIDILSRKLTDESHTGIHGACIFYDSDTPLHCRIYQVRPLICRCFGYSGERDKTGATLFPACEHMDLPEGLRTGGGIVRLSFEPFPPVMADYRRDIETLANSDTAKRMRPLGRAVADALYNK